MTKIAYSKHVIVSGLLVQSIAYGLFRTWIQETNAQFMQQQQMYTKECCICASEGFQA